jgi:hypothetical protein
MELIRKYTLPVSGFTYYVLKKPNGTEITVGKKVYEEMKKKGKINDRI